MKLGDDAGEEGACGGERRPPQDASFTADGRGAYRLLQSPTVDDVDGGGGIRSNADDQSFAASQEEDKELSWDWNDGEWKGPASKFTIIALTCKLNNNL